MPQRVATHPVTPALLDFVAAGQLVSFSPVTLGHWARGDKKAPKGFPQPIRLNGRVLRFRATDLLAWIEGLAPSHPDPRAPAPATDATPTPAPRRGRGRPRKAAHTTGEKGGAA